MMQGKYKLPKEIEPIDSDSSFLLSVTSDNGMVDRYITFTDTYDTLKPWLSGNQYAWKEHTGFTVLNHKNVWNLIHDEDDFLSFCSMMYTYTEPSEQDALVFIKKDSEKTTASFNSAFTRSPKVSSEKGVLCGGNIDDIEKAYGTNVIEEWGIDKYSYGDHFQADRLSSQYENPLFK